MTSHPADIESDSSDSDDTGVIIMHELTNDDLNLQEASDSPMENTFDLTLPTTHSYLGSNLEEVRGRTILDDGIYMNLPLLVKQSIVLFPGQTLPLTVFGTDVIEMLQNCIQKNRTFGVICVANDKMVPIGTTAEIYEYKEKDQSQGFRVKAKGRQRFKILRVEQGRGKIFANVQILPEVSLLPPLCAQRLISLDRIRMTPTNNHEAKRQEMVERYDAVVTQWPAWIYKNYDARRLSIRVRQYLQYIETQGSNIPEDPTELSFWVAQNLPLDDTERIILLNFNCAIPRLQREMKYLVKDRYFACSYCGQFIGKQSDIFPMSKEGTQTAYCNPAGVIHETITLYEARGLVLSAENPCTDYSWFPGYAWTIASCSNCHTHMGWRFTAFRNELRPKAFWGLTRRSLQPKKMRNERSHECSDDESDDEYEDSA